MHLQVALTASGRSNTEESASCAKINLEKGRREDSVRKEGRKFDQACSVSILSPIPLILFCLWWLLFGSGTSRVNV